MRIDVYGSLVAMPDQGSPPKLGPVIRLYPITITGQYDNGACFEGGIPWSAVTDLVDRAENEREQAAARHGLRLSDIQVEYHDMNIPRDPVSVERSFRTIRRLARNMIEKYADLRRKYGN